MHDVKVRDVEVYPYSGPVRQLWDDDPTWDNFARSARSVSQFYTDCLQRRGGRLPRSLVRIFREGIDDYRRLMYGSVGVRVDDLEPSDDFLSAGVTLPETATLWTSYERALVALRVQHETCLMLADRYGSSRQPFVEAFDEVVDHGLEALWYGPWKASPNRRYRARVAMRIAEDGFARLWLEVVEGHGGAPAMRSPSIMGPGSRATIERASRDFRWIGSTRLSFRSSTGRTGDVFDSAEYELIDSVSAPSAGPTIHDHQTPPTDPVLDLRFTSELEKLLPSRVLLGSINGWTDEVSREATRAWEVASRYIQALNPWWAASGWGALTIDVFVMPEAGKSSTMKTGNNLTVFVFRTLEQFGSHAQGEDVLSVLEEGIRLAARRTGIQPVPIPSEITNAVRGTT